MIECSKIINRLYQGSKPPLGNELVRSGFGCVVLCAQEYQPPGRFFEGVQVIHAGMDDDELDRETLETALIAAQMASVSLLAKDRVLVTCQQGRNRSGLVTALLLHMTTGKPGRQIVKHIKEHRRNALTNPCFARYLEALPAKAVAPHRRAFRT